MLEGFIYPVPRHPDGRLPKISSGFRTNDRPTHNGVDIMYPRSPTDGGPPNKTKLPELSPRHFMPAGIPALAIGPGVVTKSEEIKTGGYIIIEHANNVTSQYMHLFDRRVAVGARVEAGTVLGDVGFNPSGYRLIHLHFQLRKDGQLRDPYGHLASLTVTEAPRRLWLGAISAVLSGVVAARYMFR